MKLNIKATHTTLTPSVQEYLEEKIQHLQKFLKPEDKIYVEFEVDKKHQSGLIFRTEIKISPHGHYAESRGNDFYEATDLCLPKIKEQLLKSKDKQLSKKKRESRRIARRLKRKPI
jgi:ribosomal subunit interface protein